MWLYVKTGKRIQASGFVIVAIEDEMMTMVTY